MSYCSVCYEDTTEGSTICDNCAPLFTGWKGDLFPYAAPSADFIDGAHLVLGTWDDGVVVCEEDTYSVHVCRTWVDEGDGRVFSQGMELGHAREAERFLAGPNAHVLAWLGQDEDLY